jgi:hypothetical protein
MNFITHFAAYSLYPRATFEERCLFAIGTVDVKRVIANTWRAASHCARGSRSMMRHNLRAGFTAGNAGSTTDTAGFCPWIRWA